MKTSAENRNRPLKIQIVCWRFKTSADVLNFQRTFRIFSERPYIPPTTASKLPNTAIFQRNFLPAGCSGGNPVEVRYFRRFFRARGRKKRTAADEFPVPEVKFPFGPANKMHRRISGSSEERIRQRALGRRKPPTRRRNRRKTCSAVGHKKLPSKIFISLRSLGVFAF